MGKIIAGKIGGMSRWAKGGLVSAFTLLLCMAMWYHPFRVQAVSKQYVLQPSTVTFATGVTGNTNCATDITTQNNIYELASPGPSSCTATDITYQIPQTNGTTWLEGIYNTAYSQSTTVTGTSFAIAVGDDGAAGTFTIGIQLFSVSASGVKANLGSQVNFTTPSTAVANATISLSSVSGTVPAGSKLGVRVIYVGPVTGTPSAPRISVGSSTASGGQGGVLIVNEVAGDTTPPTVTAFTMPATATSTTVSVSSFTATDNVGVTGYLITESATAPTAGAAGWTATAPTSFTFAGTGARTAYAWAKDAAGNVSASLSANVTITLPDTTPPTVTAFTMPATATSTTVSVSSFTATDNVGVTGYLITESATAPAAGAAGWTATAPASFTFAGTGARTAYAWAKDAAGNVSASLSANVTITLPDTTPPSLTAFTMPSTATSLTVSVSSFAATDNVGVTGYLITESATAPAAGAAGWTATAPTSFTFSAAGARTAYAWAKDAAGNVSASLSANVTITLDTTAPTVSAFTMPTTATSLTVSVSSFTANDNVGVTGYLITESATAPAAGAAGWTATAPTSFTFSAAGARTAYAWAKDAAGNVSAGWSAAVTITLPVVNPLLHSSANLGTKYGTWGTAYNCSTCHSRTTTNVKRVNQTINTPLGARTVVFMRMTAPSNNNAVTGVFGNDLRTYAQNGSQNVCEVCHHQTLHHQYSSAKIADRTTNPHYNNQDCAGTCHPHSAGFKGSGCDGCHGNPPITASIGGGALNGLATPATGATSPASPGAHQQHAIDMGMKCATCHNGTVMPTLNNKLYMGFAANSVNVPGFVGNVAYGSYTGHTLSAPYTGFAASAGTAIGVSTTSYQNSCNVYCHGNWTGNGGSIGNPSWVGGASQGACGTCHGTDKNSTPATGNHLVHAGVAKYGFSCSKCHPSVTNTKAHVQGAVQWRLSSGGIINSGATYNGQASGRTTAPAGSTTFGQCANLYCHSNGQATPTYAPVTWGTTLNCGGCHGTDTSNSLSGKHSAHLNPAANSSLGLGNGFGCVDCHAKTVSNSTTISNRANHVNAFIDYSGARAGGSARYSTATKSCTNIYCHSNGNPGSIVFVSMTGSKTWTGAATLGCNGCHGRTGAIGAPDYANGGAGTVTANSHGKHVAGAADTTVCSTCHVKTASLTAGGKFKDYTAASYHLNKTPNVIFNTAKAGATATWTQGTGICNNVTCHGGTGSSATWGATLNCQDCHGNGASASIADFGATFWNNGTISKFQMTGTGSWAGNGHGLATGTYTGSGNPAANFGVVTNQCEFCHDSTVGHSLVSNPFRLRNYSTASYGRNAPCLTCHSATGAGVTISTTTKKRTTSKAIEADHYGTKHTSALNGGQFCWDCHDPHGTGNSNQYMVRANPAQVSSRSTSAPTTQTATAVGFTLSATPTGTDYAKSAAPYNGICNVCHTTTSHYTQTAGDSHNSTTRCTSCHSHVGSTHGSDAFKPTGHSFPYYGSLHKTAAGATPFTGCVTAGCHTNTKATSYPVTAGTPPDCQGCHTKSSPGTGCITCHGTAADGRPAGTAWPNTQRGHNADANHTAQVCSYCHGIYGSPRDDHGPGNRTVHNQTYIDTHVKTKITQWTGGNPGNCNGYTCTQGSFTHGTGESW